MADWKEKIPLVHYRGLFAALDPEEAAARCNLPFENGAFAINFMDRAYRIAHPSFGFEGGEAPLVEKLLILRYLCSGTWMPYRGTSLSYRQIPWGEVYFRNFENRCIRRLAAMFDGKTERFVRIMEALHAEKCSDSHPSYRFAFLSTFSMTLSLWPGDDEFPASAQILFDDNISDALSAEDLAVAGDAVLARLKAFPV